MTDQKKQDDRDEEATLSDLAATVVRGWKLVLGSILLAVVIGVGLILALPATYTARTVLVPSVEGGNGRADLLASQLPSALGGLVEVSTNSGEKLISSVLKSRTLEDSVVARRGTRPYSGTEQERQLRRILDDTRIQSNPDGSIELEVRDTDARRATEIANLFPELANRILSHIVTYTAERKQQFLGEQVAASYAQLQDAERRMVQFQHAQDAPELQEQAKQTLEAAATLQQQIFQQEIQVAQLRRTSTPDNPELRAAEAELSSWRGQLQRLTAAKGGSGQVFVPLGSSPELQAEATRLSREYATREQIYLSLTASLANAQLDARNNLPVVSVLDQAVVPQTPSGPSSIVILVAAIAVGVVVGICLALLRSFFRGARHDPQQERLVVAWDAFRAEVADSLVFFRKPAAAHRNGSDAERARVVSRSREDAV